MSAINEMLVKGIAPPTFEEITGAAVVTFRGNVFGPRHETAQVAGRPESRPESLDRRVLALLQPQDLGKAEISVHLGQKEVLGQLNKVIRVLMGQGLIEYTLPDKPNSRLQKYRLTPEGERALKERFGEEA
jgi:ATP-dependent DNA helicase RecG